jgi:hypothetical protein
VGVEAGAACDQGGPPLAVKKKLLLLDYEFPLAQPTRPNEDQAADWWRWEWWSVVVKATYWSFVGRRMG